MKRLTTKSTTPHDKLNLQNRIIGHMIIRGTVISIVVTLLPAFCQAQIGEDQNALNSFKKLVSDHVDSYKPNGRVHVTKLGGGWAKERFTLDPSSAKFDVEKTSSLVSPFVGTLTFTLVRNLTTFHETEAEAADDNTFIKNTAAVHKHVFAYQDHQWRPTSRVHQQLNSSLKDYFDCDEFLLKKEKRSEKDINGCLEEFDADK